MKKQLLALLLLFAVATTANAQTINKEAEKETPTIKLKHSGINDVRLNEGEFVKALRALKATQAKASRDSVRDLQTLRK